MSSVMPRLQVTSQQGKIGIKTQNAFLEMKQQKADQQIQQPKADVQIRQRPGKLSIDQSEAWKNLQFHSASDIVDQATQFGRQDWLSGLERVAREGDELMRIENKGNPIASQAKRNGVWSFSYQPGARPVYNLVSLDYQAKPADIEVNRKDPIINTTPRYPELMYQKGNVDISLTRKSQVNIDWQV